MFRKNISFISLIVMLYGIAPTIYADADSAPELPKFPVIHLVYKDKVYEGLPGSSCWPTDVTQDGEFVQLCADAILRVPSEAISISKGDTLLVKAEAREVPSRIRATLFSVDDISDTGEITATAKVTEVELNAAFVAPLTIDLSVGVHIAVIAGFWSLGDMSRVFKIAVSAKED